MLKITGRYNNRRDRILYEGREDSYGVYCSLYTEDVEDAPYEVIAHKEEHVVFQGNIHQARRWAQSF